MHAIGTRGVRVHVGDGGTRHERMCRATRLVARSHRQTSTRRLMRSIWSARPVAGSMSTWHALRMTGPSPTSNRVGSALMNRGRTVSGLKPITLHSWPGHPEVRLVGRALGQDPLVARHDVGVRPDHDRDAAVEVQAQRVLLGRDLAVEVHQADRRQGLGRLVEQPVCLRERVVDGLHERPALEVDDRELGAIERLVGAPATPRDAVGPVVERAQHAVALVEERVDLALVPDVVAGGHDVHSGGEQRLGGAHREPHAAREVLPVGGHEVHAALIAQAAAAPVRSRRVRACR